MRLLCACLPVSGSRLGLWTVTGMEKAAHGITTVLLVCKKQQWLGRVKELQLPSLPPFKWNCRHTAW